MPGSLQKGGGCVDSKLGDATYGQYFKGGRKRLNAVLPTMFEYIEAARGADTELLEATEKEAVANVKIEFNRCIALNYKNIEETFLNKELRNRMEKYTIDEEFDVSFFAKKAMYVIFNLTFSEFFGVNKKELTFSLYDDI